MEFLAIDGDTAVVLLLHKRGSIIGLGVAAGFEMAELPLCLPPRGRMLRAFAESNTNTSDRALQSPR